MDKQPKITPLTAIAQAVTDALRVECTTGEGQELYQFLESTATVQKDGLRIFVAYTGFRAGARYSSGYETSDGAETYSLYIQAHDKKSVRETVNKLRSHLREEPNAEFTDDAGEKRFISATGGAAMREKGFGVFEMQLTIT